MGTLVIIPARGGSKGIPGKNLRQVAGISLVGHAVRAALEFKARSRLTDALVFVDTDAPDIAREAQAWGASVPFLRSAELAADDTSTVDSTLGAIDRLAAAGSRFDDVVLLQPTSPLRTAADIDWCWREYDRQTSPSVLSVCRAAHPVSLALKRDAGGCVQWLDAATGGVRRRQDAGAAWRISGAVYITSVEFLQRERAFIVPGATRGVELSPERSVDIDTPADLDLADAMMGLLPAATVSIGETVVGGGAPCFVIAEAGVNHNGDVRLAHSLVDVAADAGADAVKFQTFDPDLLVSRDAVKAEYQIAATGAGESQHEMLQRLTLRHEDFVALATHAADRGIRFLSTAFDEGSADFLAELGVDAFKIPSGEVTNHPFLEHIARKGRPMLVSTGMASIVEVDAAVRVIRASGNPPLAIFHCVSNYPASAADCNLRAMDTMRRAFGVPTGWSDHTTGLTLSLAAVGMGAEILEKHFTLDRTLPGPDHAASLEPAELNELMTSIRDVERARGTGLKVAASSEAGTAAVARRSLHAKRRLAAGHVLTAADLIALRPGTGLSPSARDRVIGRTLLVDVAEGEILSERHLG